MEEAQINLKDLIVSRLRILSFILISAYLISNFSLESGSIILYLTMSLFYSSLIYYLISRGKLNESFFISLLDLIIVLLFLSISDLDYITLKFLFLIYLPSIKEIIYKNKKNAYMLSFLGNIILIFISYSIRKSLPLEITFSLLPFSFLIPYLSWYYVKEMEGI